MARDGWRSVWLFALTSLIADISGEMVMAVLPFVLIAQGATGLGLGLVGGVADGIGNLMKLFGGYAYRFLRRPLLLVGGGYVLANLSRIGVAFAASWPATLAFRSFDRVGKGLRTAPRDALLADAVPAHEQARAFGLHRASDTTGAVIGVLLALAGLTWFGVSERTLVLVGAAIGFTSIIPLFFIRPARDPPPPENGDADGNAVTKPYLIFLGVSALFAMGRVSYLFFLVRATSAGFAVATAVLWYLLFNVVYAASSFPFGQAADLWGRRRVLLAGYLLGAAAAVPFLLPLRTAYATAGFVALGLSFAAVEGNQRALAADLAGRNARAARLGEFHATTGFATLLGGIVAGLLWDHVSPAWTFRWSAVLSLLAAAGIGLMLRHGVARRKRTPLLP